MVDFRIEEKYIKPLIHILECGNKEVFYEECDNNAYVSDLEQSNTLNAEIEKASDLEQSNTSNTEIEKAKVYSKFFEDGLKVSHNIIDKLKHVCEDQRG